MGTEPRGGERQPGRCAASSSGMGQDVRGAPEDRSRGLCVPRTWGHEPTPCTASHRIQHLPPNLLLCRRLLSIRGVNDVLLSKGFLIQFIFHPHTMYTKAGDGGRTGEQGFWYFPTQGRCHEVSVGFLFYTFPCPFVNHRREEVPVKPPAHPLQFPLCPQRDLGTGLVEKKRARNREG